MRHAPAADHLSSGMPNVDLNLLVALDVLLAEGSVTGAARRLGLSPSAMSRTLARLRDLTGDPLLVQAGRTLVPTAYAEGLSARVHALVNDAQAVLRPAANRLDLGTLRRTFTLRAGEGFVELLGAPLMAAIAKAAAHVRIRFAPKLDRDALPLREGLIDLEIGVLGTSAPEVRTQLLFRDRYVGIARIGHPLLGRRPVSLEDYAACTHVAVSRQGEFHGPVDKAMGEMGLKRDVPLTVPAYTDAMRISRYSEMVTVVPHSCLGNVFARDNAAAMGLAPFELPVETRAFNVSAIWHPRLDTDPAHRWLRRTIVTLCRSAYPP